MLQNLSLMLCLNITNEKVSYIVCLYAVNMSAKYGHVKTLSLLFLSGTCD